MHVRPLCKGPSLDWELLKNHRPHAMLKKFFDKKCWVWGGVNA